MGALWAVVLATPALATPPPVTAKAASARPAPLVVDFERAPLRVAPHGKARVRLLARGENAFVGRLEIDPGVTLPPHRDPTEEYVHVLAGSGVVSIDGVETAVGPGATIYMPADALVSYRNGPETAVVLQIFAGPTPAERYRQWRLVEQKAPGVYTVETPEDALRPPER